MRRVKLNERCQEALLSLFMMVEFGDCISCWDYDREYLLEHRRDIYRAYDKSDDVMPTVMKRYLKRLYTELELYKILDEGYKILSEDELISLASTYLDEVAMSKPVKEIYRKVRNGEDCRKEVKSKIVNARIADYKRIRDEEERKKQRIEAEKLYQERVQRQYYDEQREERNRVRRYRMTEVYTAELKREAHVLMTYDNLMQYPEALLDYFCRIGRDRARYHTKYAELYEECFRMTSEHLKQFFSEDQIGDIMTKFRTLWEQFAFEDRV